MDFKIPLHYQANLLLEEEHVSANHLNTIIISDSNNFINVRRDHLQFSRRPDRGAFDPAKATAAAPYPPRLRCLSLQQNEKY